jgi:hypothetical protein
MMRFRTIALAGLVAAALGNPAAAATIWDEGVDGDLSGNQSAPTGLVVGAGTNSIAGVTQTDDVDFFTFTVPDGASLVQIILTSFESADDLAFLAIESGPVITSTASADHLLGWLHVSAAYTGTNILDDLPNGLDALGFIPPLGPGTYTVWMQQTGADPVAYGLDLVLSVPEPATALLFALGIGALGVARRRRA